LQTKSINLLGFVNSQTAWCWAGYSGWQFDGVSGGTKQANERMQLTWLIGAPNRPGSVHGRAVGQVGLGSLATQLMRAVRRTHLGHHESISSRGTSMN